MNLFWPNNLASAWVDAVSNSVLEHSGELPRPFRDAWLNTGTAWFPIQ